MKLFFVSLCIVSMASCGRNALEEGDLKEDSLKKGMLLKEANVVLMAHGVRKIEGTYPFFWRLDDEEGEALDAGHSDFYDLRDKTCLQIVVSSMVNQEPRVHMLTLGVKGKGYRGKIKWMDDDDAGLHRECSGIVLKNGVVVTTTIYKKSSTK